VARPILDTNVLLRHLTQDVPELAAMADDLLRRIEHGELAVQITDVIVFETVFTLQRHYRADRRWIVEGLLPIIELPGIELAGKRLYRRTFDLYLRTPMGFADCYHAALMERDGVTEVFSFDRDFDRLPGVVRRET
jgi:uncharacterized protein